MLLTELCKLFVIMRLPFVVKYYLFIRCLYVYEFKEEYRLTVSVVKGSILAVLTPFPRLGNAL